MLTSKGVFFLPITLPFVLRACANPVVDLGLCVIVQPRAKKRLYVILANRNLVMLESKLQSQCLPQVHFNIVRVVASVIDVLSLI